MADARISTNRQIIPAGPNMSSRRTMRVPYRSTDARAMDARGGEQAHGDAAAVQGRYRDQVEKGQQAVELHRYHAHQAQRERHHAYRGVGRGTGAVHHRLDQERGVECGQGAEDQAGQEGQSAAAQDEGYDEDQPQAALCRPRQQAGQRAAQEGSAV